jgi:putative ABC transport system permease protein
MFDSLLQDLRYAARQLGKHRGFTVVAALTLALGIGANTAIYSVVNAVLLRPLAYAHPDRLVALQPTVNRENPVPTNLSAPEFLDLQSNARILQGVAAAWPIDINLTGTATPERVQAAVVSSNFFQLLGVAPMLGRDFTPEDAGGRIGYVVVISWDLWQRQFGGDPGVIGKTVRFDDDPMSIIGVMPRGFHYPLDRIDSPMEVWAPVDMASSDPNFINARRARVFEVFGRLAPGVTLEAARSGLEMQATQFRQQFPNAYPDDEGWRLAAQPLADRLVGGVRSALIILLGAVGLVLLIACVNVANLMLTRAMGRQRELAIRTAIGAARARIVRQLLTESLLLAVLGGGLGVLLATWGTSGLGRLAALYLPRAGTIAVDGRVLAFAGLLSVVTGLAFGILPALQASRTDLQGALRDAGPGLSMGTSRARTRAALVVVEIALALMLVTGACLLLRSFASLGTVDPGFRAEGVLTMQLWLPWPNKPETGRFFTQAQRLQFYQRVQDAVSQVPGVAEVGLTSRLPLTGSQFARYFEAGHPVPPGQLPPLVEMRQVSANYFTAMGIPLLRGEALSPLADSAQANRVLVNRAFAERNWKGEDAIGRHLVLGGAAGPEFIVAGVVGDVRTESLENPAPPIIYVPIQQAAGLQMALAIRVTGGDATRHQAAIVQAIHRIDPTQPVFGVMPMTKVVADAGAARRFSLLLLSLFAGIALLLSAIGIYGVMVNSANQRRQEIGIRLALGASPRAMFRMIVGQGARLALLGVAAGLLGAWLLSRVLAGQLYAIKPHDTPTFLVASVLLGFVAVVGSSLPAVRAARLDPISTLRSE